MLQELEDHVDVVLVGHRQLDGDLQHVVGEQGHPGGPVCLLQVAAGGQGRTAVEQADVVEAQEPSLEDVAPGPVLAVHPPGEVQEELLEGALQPPEVALAFLRLLQTVGEDRGPGMHRRIDVAEIPLVGGNLAVRVHVVFAEHEAELLLAEVEVHQSQGQDVEGEVPGRVPRVLPLVGHGEHVAVVHVVPVLVPGGGLAGGAEGIGAPLREPLVHVVSVELLRPEHARQGLTHYVGRIGVERRGD